MPHPIGYYASARDGSADAIILAELEQKLGSWLEKLTSEQKIVWAIALLKQFANLDQVQVSCNIQNIPGLKQILQLTSGNKLALVKALVSYIHQQ